MDPAQKGRVLDEDDQFQEFEKDDWSAREQDPKNEALWVNTWDDDSLGDYVGTQVRTYFQQQQQGAAQQPQS